MAELTLVIGNKNYSSWSLRPWVAMTHFQIPFAEVLIPLFMPRSKARLLDNSPSGKVPALKHADIVVWESIAILEYLADLFPEKDLWPKDTRARAYARSVSAEMHAGFMNLRKNCPMNIKADRSQTVLNEDAQRDVERITELWEDCRKRFGRGGEFLFGDFSNADAMYAPIIWRCNSYGINLTGTSKKYFDSMISLPAMKEWQEAALKETWVIEGH